MPHWSVTARFKLSSTQPVRCWTSPSVCFEGCLGLRGLSDKQTVNLAPGKHQRMKKQPILWLTSKLECQDHVSWPLRRSTSPVDDSRKTATINCELKRLNIDIAALEKSRLQSNVSLREQDYVVLLAREADQDSWPCSVCHFVVGRLNENGQRLLELCFYHDLCITNTFFSTKPNHRVSWHHPRSRHWHQLDPFSLVSSVPVVTTALTAVSAVYRAWYQN